MTRKVFQFEAAPETVTPEFEVAGETFTCVTDREISSLDILDYIAGLTGDSGVERITTMRRLFDVFLIPDDRERFRKTIREARVPLATLNDIASWVLDE